jgi:protein-S-isoprenylcysteine O-methyltransferase Ste14
VTRRGAAIGSAIFFLLAPGIVAGVLPWSLTHWRVATPLPHWTAVRVAGAALIVAGLVAVVRAFARFVSEGRGTPAPVTSTERLVVGGLYRYVRNPMYLAVAATIVGQALLLGRLPLLLYAAFFGVVVATFVRVYEEPALARRFGAEYEAYRRAVPSWWPRRRPWAGSGREDRLHRVHDNEAPARPREPSRRGGQLRGL